MSEKRNLHETIMNDMRFTTFAKAVTAAGLTQTLTGEGPFTIFAPNENSFGEIQENTLVDLLKPENKDKLVEILTYHIVLGQEQGE